VERTLVVVHNIAEVISAAIVRLSYAHGVVGEVDIAVVAFGGSAMVKLSNVGHLQKSEDKLVHCVNSDIGILIFWHCNRLFVQKLSGRWCLDLRKGMLSSIQKSEATKLTVTCPLPEGSKVNLVPSEALQHTSALYGDGAASRT
jgi:hypothetical protein